MVIGAWMCLLLAVLIGAAGVRTLSRRSSADLTAQVLRMVAPTQLAAAVMLAAGGVVALLAPARFGLPALVVGVAGAVGTVAAGSWQGARYAAARESAGGCGSEGGCGTCTKACG